MYSQIIKNCIVLWNKKTGRFYEEDTILNIPV